MKFVQFVVAAVHVRLHGLPAQETRPVHPPQVDAAGRTRQSFIETGAATQAVAVRVGSIHGPMQTPDTGPGKWSRNELDQTLNFWQKFNVWGEDHSRQDRRS